MEYLPKWHRELSIFRRVKSLLVLEGNVLDSFQYPTDGSIPAGSIVQLPEYLHHYFTDCGYQNTVFYDHLEGFTNPYDSACLTRFAQLTGTTPADRAIPASFRRSGADSAAAIVQRAVAQAQEATVVILNFASRYILSPDHMQAAESDSFTLLLKASLRCSDVRTERGMLRNLIVAIVSKANDLPAWLLLQNPTEQTIRIQTPSAAERAQLVKGAAFRSFFDSTVYTTR